MNRLIGLITLVLFVVLQGCSSNDEELKNEKPSLQFSYEPVVGKKNTFLFKAKIDGDYDLLRWNLGNGQEVTKVLQTTVTYAYAGTYTVTLKVWVGLEEYSTTQEIEISEDLIQLDFTAVPRAENLNMFDFSATVGGIYEKITWDFGNGEAKEDVLATTILYGLKGNYSVTLSVWSGGIKFQKTKSIEVVKNAIEISIDAQASNSHQYAFKAIIEGQYERFEWVIRGKTISNQTDVVGYFPFENNYEVVLNVYAYQRLFKISKIISIASDDPDYVNQLRLVWQEEFDQDGVDRSNWTFETGSGGWGNNELQNYTNGDNVHVSNGMLVLTARKVNDDKVAGSYTSTRMITKGKKEFTYGRLEIRAKLPGGKGIWPAIWMLGSNINTVGWPACGEIDIMEYVGKDPGVVHSSIHTQSFNHSIGTQKTKSYSLPDAETAFHNYGVIWTEKSMKFYIDEPNNVFFTFNKEGVNDTGKWPFDKPCFFILNIAVGGNWGGEVDNAIFPQTMEIDYVRVYQE